MKFGGIGVPELLIILAVVLLIFGPKNLPKLGSAIGRTVKNLREGMNSAPDIEIDEDDKKAEKDDDEAEEAEEEPERKVVKRRKNAAEEPAEEEE